MTVYDTAEVALKELTDARVFEEVAGLVVCELFPGLRLTGPTGDLHRDGYVRRPFARVDDAVLLVSLQRTWKAKLGQELAAIESQPATQRPKRAVYASNQRIREQDRAPSTDRALRAGVALEIVDLDELAFKLDTDTLRWVAETRLKVRPRAPRVLIGPAEFYSGLGFIPGITAALVDRDDVLGRLGAFAADPDPTTPRVLVVEGAGGTGKTRVAVDGASSAATTFIARAGTHVTPEVLTVLPGDRPAVVVVDDAHRSRDLSGIAAMVGDPRFLNIKVILTVRSGLTGLALETAGLTDRPRTVESLGGLTRANIAAIVGAHGITDSAFIRAVLQLAEGSPLIAHTACERAMAAGRFGWRDGGDILDDLVVTRMLKARDGTPADDARAVALALAVLSSATGGEGLAALCGSVSCLPADPARLDSLLADLADAGLAEVDNPFGSTPLYALRPHPVAAVLVADALKSGTRVHLRVEQTLKVLGRAASEPRTGGQGRGDGPLGIGALANDPASGLQTGQLASQLEVLAQAAVRAEHRETKQLLRRALTHLIPVAANTDVWCDVLLLAEQVAPAVPELLLDLHGELIRQWPPTPNPPSWVTPSADHYGFEILRVAQQVRSLVSRAGDSDPVEAARLLLDVAHRAAGHLDQQRLTDVLAGVATIAVPAGVLTWGTLLSRRRVVLDAVTAWVGEHLPPPGKLLPATRNTIDVDAARVALAALHPFLVLVVEIVRVGTPESDDVLELSHGVLPDEPDTWLALASAADTVAAIVGRLNLADPAAAETIRTIIKLPRELVASGARGVPGTGTPLPAAARAALARTAATVSGALATRWAALPLWARHSAAVAAARGTGARTLLTERAAAGDPVAARALGDVALNRLFVLLPADRWVEISAGELVFAPAGEHRDAAMALAVELGWQRGLDLLAASAPVQEDVTLVSYREVFAERLGAAVTDPAEVRALLLRLSTSDTEVADPAVLRGLLQSSPDTVAALRDICGTLRGAALGLSVLQQLGEDEDQNAILDSAHRLVIGRGDDSSDDRSGAIVGAHLLSALYNDTDHPRRALRRLVALGVDGPVRLLPRVLSAVAHLINRSTGPAGPGFNAEEIAAAVPVLGRRLAQSTLVPADLDGDHETAHAVAVLVEYAPNVLADLFTARLVDPAPVGGRWPFPWRETVCGLSAAARAPFAAVLLDRVDHAVGTADLSESHRFDIDQILGWVCAGTSGWTETLLRWATSGPAQQLRAVAAVAGGWQLPTWAPVVSALLTSGVTPTEESALMVSVQLHSTGPDIREQVDRRREVLDLLEPAGHPAIRRFHDAAVEGLTDTIDRYYQPHRGNATRW